MSLAQKVFQLTVPSVATDPSPSITIETWRSNNIGSLTSNLVLPSNTNDGTLTGFRLVSDYYLSMSSQRAPPEALVVAVATIGIKTTAPSIVRHFKSIKNTVIHF